MPLGAPLFALPLPVPTAPTTKPVPPDPPPEVIATAVSDLQAERAKLSVFSRYRTAIVSNNLVPNATVPYTIAQINTMIAEQRAAVAQQEVYLRALLEA